MWCKPVLFYRHVLKALKRAIGNRNPVRLGYHAAKAFVAAAASGFPARKLTVIGITGTDGKTTTVGMVAHILHESGINVGALSTAFFRVQDKVEWNETRLTSPSPFAVQRFLKKLVDAGCTHAVIEYSSHGLVQHRTDFTYPKVAAITNLSEEHLDYHGTMEQYQADKKILFKMLNGQGTKVLNRDDRTFVDYQTVPSSKTFTYGKSKPENADSGAHYWMTDLEGTRDSLSATVHRTNSDESFELKLTVPGLFNLENALCALCCTEAAGIGFVQGSKAIESYRSAPGRMEKIDAGQDFSVYVDFTVSPNAFVKTMEALRATMTPGQRLLVMTGSCGDRMREKRPQIGAICSRLADVVVITDDETYTEDPKKIIEEIWKGVDQTKIEAHKVEDRKEAIKFILKQATTGDVVLLCGMGSYPLRQTLKGLVPWNEQDIVREILRG